MSDLDAAGSNERDPSEAEAQSDEMASPALLGAPHTLADDMLMVGETIRAILSL
jgi:hypothetical protein